MLGPFETLSVGNKGEKVKFSGNQWNMQLHDPPVNPQHCTCMV